MNFSDELSKYRKIVDKELGVFLNRKIKDASSDPFLKELYLCIKEYVMHGGKRLRPIMPYNGV